MHELLGDGADAATASSTVRVVRGGDVAALRRSCPDTAIVALVRSTDPRAAVAAQLAGADVVLPCADQSAPDAEDLAAARAAATLLAGRARQIRDQTREAAHEVAGQASSVALVAQLLGPQEPPQRAAQLRELAARGRALAWRAGRVGRARGAAVEVVDLSAWVPSLLAARADETVGAVAAAADDPDGRVEPAPTIRVAAPPEPAPVLVDPARLAAALAELTGNAARAGARTISVQVAAEAGDGPGFCLTVEDDGVGLPAGWTPDRVGRPFVAGRPGGAGLGLAEAAEFAADHGGSLTVGPRPAGPGARAVLRFPAAPPPAATARTVGAVGAVGTEVAVVGVGTGRTAADADHDTPERPDHDRALAAVLEGIAARRPLPESLEALVATMERHLPGSRCSILLLDQDAGTLHHGAGARLPEPYRRAIDGLLIGPSAGSCGTAAYTRQEVVVADIATDPRWDGYREHALRFGLRSCWSRPILDVDRGGVLGTFAVYHQEPWAPDRAAVELVERLTHVAAIAIGTDALHGRLVESEARFRSTFEAAGLGIALVDPSGLVQEANAALVEIAGRPVTGESFAGLLVEPDASATRAALAALLEADDPGQRMAAVEVRVRRPDRVDDEPIWVALSGSLIRGPAGEPRHYCLELFDLTERRRIAQAWRDREIALAGDRAKSELLALVSHEVRTPLHAIIGFAQVLQSMPLPPDRQQAAIEHILGSGRHLLQLINDLIDLTGAESRQLHLVLEDLPAGEVVTEAAQIVTGLAEERAITLCVRAGAGRPPLRADRQRLRQVLLNLLGNAIKFTPPGGRVEIGGPDGDGPAEIVVRDTGPGIPADHLPRLFTPFHRAGTTHAHGSGLGLALSQRLARAMDGDLTLIATSPTGSTFRLTLPVADTRTGAAAAAGPAVTAAAESTAAGVEAAEPTADAVSPAPPSPASTR